MSISFFVVVLSLVFVAISANFPHFASFDVEAVDGYRTCGGSLISNTGILTAASCFDISERIFSLIALGVSKIEDEIVYSDAEKVFIHEEYRKNPLRNDIALISIQPVEFNKNIQPIKLIDFDTENEINQEVTVSGLPENEKSTFTLLTNSKCAARLQRKILESNLCLFTPSICTEFWARGGAVFLHGSDGLDMQIALISNVTEECLEDTPIAVTRIGSYLSWIQTKGF